MTAPSEDSCERTRLDEKCRLKYAFDRILACLFLPLFALTCAAAAILMAIEARRNPQSRGPLFYTEERWSQGRPFRIYKFRTSFPGTQGAGEIGRVTWAGRLLKKWYLDEAPQVLNVLRGEMTLVGPRPTVPWRARGEIDREGMRSKLVLRAGLTGLVQVYKREARDRIVYANLEEQYLQEIDRRSPLGVVCYDLSLLARTIPMMLRGEGL